MMTILSTVMIMKITIVLIFIVFNTMTIVLIDIVLMKLSIVIIVLMMIVMITITWNEVSQEVIDQINPGEEVLTVPALVRQDEAVKNLQVSIVSILVYFVRVGS